MATLGTRRYDPERRARIIEATLEVVELHGVAGTTHRRVAAAADVPLGSMSYHFEGIEQLLVEAFSLFTSRIADSYAERLKRAKNLQEAREAVVDIICGKVWVTNRSMLLTHELYAYASRSSAMKEVQRSWMTASRRALQAHFDARTTRALDSIIEGVTIHNSASSDLLSRAEVARIVMLLTTEESLKRRNRLDDKG